MTANKIIQRLTEARSANLYHFTSARSLIGILKDNVLRASKEPIRVEVNKPMKMTLGLSLTRDSKLGKDEVAIVLDQLKLTNNYKIVPRDYFMSKDPKLVDPDRRREESEEFLLGNVKDIDKYILEIRLSRPIYDSLPEEAKSNPKLKIV